MGRIWAKFVEIQVLPSPDDYLLFVHHQKVEVALVPSDFAFMLASMGGRHFYLCISHVDFFWFVLLLRCIPEILLNFGGRDSSW
jgi:hypothetical protein